MKYTFEDFVSPQQKPESLPATEAELFRKEIADLREQVEMYRQEIQHTSYNDWFRQHITQLADEATKNFPQSLVRQHLDAVVREQGLQAVVEKVVAEVFEREAQELYKAIRQSILSYIQPIALKR